MNVSVGDLVDYARGIASEEVAKAIEADPQLLAEAARFAKVKDALEPLPELWLLRAKALVTKPVVRGRFTLATGGLALGFRSADEGARDLVCDLPDGRIEVRVESVPRSEERSVAGVNGLPNAEGYRVGTNGEWLESCSEDGFFALRLSPDAAAIQFFHPGEAILVEVELP